MTVQPGRRPRATSALHGHVGRYQNPGGNDLLQRTEPFFDWVLARRESDLWPFSRSLDAAPATSALIRDDRGSSFSGLNFASQDYLGLARHPAVHDAIREALTRFGPHSAGSPVLLGNTADSLRLERDLADVLAMPEVVLFPTGWAAGFASIQALVREADHVVLDARAHACLQQGARAATRNIHLAPHLEAEAVRLTLQQIRATDCANAVLVVTEGLFSMDSDSPDLARLQEHCREYNATLLVDIAHDFGATGPGGTGALGVQKLIGQVDLVMGSFSKTFASNGGFLACHSPAVKQFVKYFGGPHLFSNALSPLQTAAVRQALIIVRSPQGNSLRESSQAAALALRRQCRDLGLACLGIPSPIVPVVVGTNAAARVASTVLARSGVLANLVEYPAVPIGTSRFRFQVMAAHSVEDCHRAGTLLAESLAHAHRLLSGGGAADMDARAGRCG